MAQLQQAYHEAIASLATPCLIVQGARDPFGTQGEVGGYLLSPSIHVAWIPDGDHSFVPPKRSGHSEAGNLQLAVEHLADFVHPTA